MPDGYTFILDAPDTPATRVQIAKLGRGFKDPRYGTFDITAAEVAQWSKNLALLPGGRALIDTDHDADKPGRKTEAAGWITGVELDNGVPTATVEWTPLGEAAIKERRYLFFSPTYGNWRDEHGNVTPNTLRGGALTNRPFLNMPAITLSQSAWFVEQPTDPPPDSRPAMSDLLKTLAKLHGLPEDADEAKVLEAARAAKAKAEAPPPNTDTRTLAQMAEAEGLRVLSADDHAKLLDGVERGVKAERQLADMTFDAAYTTALQRGALDTKPETRELHAAIYQGDPDRSLKLLESLPAGVVKTSPTGTGGHTEEAPDGVDPDSFELDKRVTAHMAEHKVDYVTALDAVLAVDDAKTLAEAWS